MIGYIKHEIWYLYQDKLYRNASYLMLSNIIIALTGFFFWLIAARLYTPEDVGLATALISAMGLFVVFSTSGFDPTFIRFLPSMNSEERSRFISTAFLFSIAVSAILSVIFILFIDFFAPKLDILKFPVYSLIFILFTIVACMFFLLNGMFIARRKCSFLLIKTSLQCILKVLFLPFLILVMGMGIWVGIFLSYSFSIIVALFFALFLLLRVYPRIKICFDIKVLKKAFKFLSGNYISSIFSQLPNFLFPIIVLNLVSGADAAYFYMPWHIFFIFLSFIGPINAALLMEGSYKKDIRKDQGKAIKLSFLVVLGGIALFFMFGRPLLSLFGKGYADSVNLLYVLALSLIPASINQIYLTVKNIRKEIREFTGMNVFIYSSSLVLGTLSIPYFGIIGIGYGWLIGQTLGVVWIGLKIFKNSLRKQ